jgi:hypothetical protein
MKTAVFLDVAPCGLIINRRFGGTHHLLFSNASEENCWTLTIRLTTVLPVPTSVVSHVPPKRRFVINPNGVTSLKTTFFTD